VKNIRKWNIQNKYKNSIGLNNELDVQVFILFIL